MTGLESLSLGAEQYRKLLGNRWYIGRGGVLRMKAKTTISTLSREK
jgi:hypothetical protein